MTYQHDFTFPTELLEQVSSQGLDILPEIIRVMINAAMQRELAEVMEVREILKKAVNIFSRKRG